MSYSDIFLALEARLRNAELLPGSQILEAELMQEFAVSRTPVRDALLRLQALGYLTIYPRKGIFVARLTVREVLEQLEVLAHLEGLCAQLAAQRMTQPQRSQLLQLLQQAKDAANAHNASDYALANQGFHALLYAGCCSNYLVQQILQIRTRTAGYRLKRFESAAGLQRSLQEHTELAHAVRQGDEAAAYQASVRHISIGGAEYAELVRQIPEELFAHTHHRRPAPSAALTQWSFAKVAQPHIAQPTPEK